VCPVWAIAEKNEWRAGLPPRGDTTGPPFTSGLGMKVGRTIMHDKCLAQSRTVMDHPTLNKTENQGANWPKDKHEEERRGRWPAEPTRENCINPQIKSSPQYA
jgi:hypothetical protein